MNGRYCTGSQPFKYFMETDPTVPMWVKKIQQNDIETWNTVLNKQDKLTAGKHIIIDNNEISFDHDIDLMASDFQYLPIGNERIYNDLRNYFITLNGEEFIPIDIMNNTAYMQWQDGIYIVDDSQNEWVALSGGYNDTYEYKAKKNNVILYLYDDDDKYEVWAKAFLYARDILGSNGISYIDDKIDYYDVDDYENSTFISSFDSQWDYGDEINYPSENIVEFNINNGGVTNNFFYLIKKSNLSSYVENNVILQRSITYRKISDNDSYDETVFYFVYNRNLDTYSEIFLNENTFKQRQNGLYIRNAYWDKDTLLTAKNIDQLMYDLVDTAYAHAKDTAYQNFVTNQLKDYVNGRIASLNLNTYATNTALNNLITRFNILSNQVNDIDDEVGDISSTREYLITTGNGLKKTYINEGTLNQVAHLELDIRPMPDGYLNEETKKYLHLEDGYNGFFISNDLIYQDWIYKLTPQGNYIPDGEGGWQKEQLDHYVIGMPFTERLVPARVAVSSKAVLEELNDNYEMKLITLGSNVQIVDLAYYKQLWGATGATFTEADFKALTAEWYDVNWDYDTPENQAIMKMYTYNGENGERLYRHQRAITFIPSESGDIYSADVYTAIENPTKSQFDNRTEPWYTYDSVNDMYYYVSLDAEFDSEETYYTLGSQQSKYTIPSCDGVAKFVESLDLDYTDGKVYLSIIERPNTINARKVDIDNVTIVDDTTKSTNTTWSSNKIDTEITNAINALDATEVGGTNKYISAISEADGKISATVGDIDTSVTSNSNNLITSGAVAAAIDALPEPMVFQGSVGSGGTIEWANLPSSSSSNKGWTYKVITDHNTAPICKIGDTIISDSTTWVVIPSGDEPSGTVTNVAIQGETNYIEVSGSPITSSGTITITAGQTIKNKRDLPTTLTTFSGSVTENTNYILSTAISSLTISSIANSSLESNIIFEVTGSSFSITFPANTPMIGDEPTYESGEKYIVSICNGIVIVAPITV